MKDNRHITRFDIIAILVITIIYSVVSFINLGDTVIPQTQPDLGNADKKEYITYASLDEPEFIDSLMIFKGLGKCGITVYKSDDGGKSWEEAAKQVCENIYTWEKIKLECTAKNLCISVGGNSELEIFEAGFKTEDGATLAVNTDNCRLFDEQELVPLYPSYMNGTYFDEIHHVRTAYEHIKAIKPYEITHPPLGKILIACGIKMFGMNPFGWRFSGNIFGILMLALMYVFSKRIFKNSYFALTATLLLAVDFMHFTQTRIATIDSFAVFFIMLMYYLMYIYYDSSGEELPYKKSLWILTLCGIVFGLGIATKWIAVYAGAGLAILFAAAVYKRYKNGELPFKTCLWCVLFFVLIPFGIYFLSYIPYFITDGKTSAIKTFWDNQVYMLTYHGGLESVHQFESKWYTWPLMLKPVWYFGSKELAHMGLCSTIAVMGNPAVWWLGSLCLILIVLKRKKCGNSWFITAGFLSQFIPWAFIERSTFIYHFFASVPFIILALVFVLKNISEKFKKGRIITLIIILISIMLFFMFYPVISGCITSRGYVLKILTWFDSWILCF